MIGSSVVYLAYSMSGRTNEDLTPAKKPQALVPKRNIVEVTKTGRLPHTAAAAAVKKVPPPVVSCNSPTKLNDI
jgi:hypothetical protein